MNDRSFLEHFWFLFADDCLVEVVFEVRQPSEFPLVGLGADALNPSLNFDFYLISDEFTIVKAALTDSPMLGVKYNGGDIFY